MSAAGSTSTLNGTTGSQVDPLDRIIEELESEKAPISARRAQLESEIADLIKREDRINAGIYALKAGRPKTTTPAKPGKPGGNPPSQKLLDDVYAAIAVAAKEGRDPMTIVQISEVVGRTRSAVDNAVRHLRSEQRIRLCGTAPLPGSPKIYGPMP